MTAEMHMRRHGKILTVLLHLDRTALITLSSLIAGGVEAGAVACLGPSATAQDIELWERATHELLKALEKLPSALSEALPAEARATQPIEPNEP